MKDVVNKDKVKKVHSKFKLNDGSLTENKTVISNKFNEFKFSKENTPTRY